MIAYGSTSRCLNTGNVPTIKSIEIEKQPVNNPLPALQARVPGFFVDQRNGDNGNPLSSINPVVVESIGMLKDADATAIYGCRDVNDVILITTKKGKKKRSYFGIQH